MDKKQTRGSAKQLVLARRVLAYLRCHPNAEETLEGITQWWLLKQRIQESVKQVDAALNLLVMQKHVIVRRQLDGQVYFRLNRQENM